MIALVVVFVVWSAMVQAPYNGPTFPGCGSIVVEREGCSYDR